MRAELMAVATMTFAHSACATLDNGHVGSTSQAVTNNDVANLSLAFSNGGNSTAEYGSACEVTDPQSPGSAKFMIGAAGKQSNGTYSNNAVLFRPGVPTYDPDARTTFTDGRWHATMVKDPNDSHACLLGGGENGSSVLGQLVKLTAGWSSGTSKYTLTATNVGTLSTARSYVQAVTVGTKVYWLGGFTGTGKTSASAVMDVWDSTQSGSTAIPTFKNTSNGTVTLNHPRGDFGAGVSGQNSSRVLLGGGTGLNSVEGFVVDANGNLDSSSATHPSDVTALSPSSHTTIGTARDGLMLLYASQSSGKEKWVAGPGNELAEVQSFNIDWSNFTTADNTAPTDACTGAGNDLLAVTDPLNVKMAANRFIMVGSSGSNKNSVQEYDAGTCTHVTTDLDSQALVSRQGALGALVGGHVYYTTGQDGSGNFFSSTFQVY
jgi:hypothetical protein